MKKKLLGLYHFLLKWVPPALLPAGLYVANRIKYFFTRRAYKLLLADWNSAKSIRKSDTAVIYATGPSLKLVNLDELKHFDSFSVSNFFLHEKLEIASPKIHFFAPFHEPLVYSDFIAWWKKADDTLPESTEICLSLDSFNMIKKEGLFLNRKVRFLDFSKAQYSRKPSPLKPILGPQSSPLMVLPVLLWMGYKRIILAGCDHNILKNYGGNVDNFYDNSRDIRSNATSGDNWRFGIIAHLDYQKNVFCQYHFYLKYAQANNIELINISKESWLDFIPYSDAKELGD